MITDFTCKNPQALTKEDIIKAASAISCDPLALHAVSEVEAPHGGFFSSDKGNITFCYPTILFEAKTFHTLTKGQFDKSHPNISSPVWNKKLYGAGGWHQYERLLEAIKLSYREALESASWGKYQIMGLNYYNAGYDNVEDFVLDIIDEAELSHLGAFVAFIQNTNIVQYLINKDWARFAAHYNGPGQVPYYAQKIEEAYNKGW